MIKLLSILTVFAFAGTAVAAPYVSVGTCTEVGSQSDSPFRVLLDVENKNQGLLVGESSNPDNSSVSLMVAESVSIKKKSENQYNVTLSQSSMLGMISKSSDFSVTKDGAEWKGAHRTYICKID